MGISAKGSDYERQHKNPANWNGPFYNNPSDPRVLVPKRFAWAGWTFNVAHPLKSLATFVVFTLIVTVPFFGLRSIGFGSILWTTLTLGASIVVISLISYRMAQPPER